MIAIELWLALLSLARKNQVEIVLQVRISHAGADCEMMHMQC